MVSTSRMPTKVAKKTNCPAWPLLSEARYFLLAPKWLESLFSLQADLWVADYRSSCVPAICYRGHINSTHRNKAVESESAQQQSATPTFLLPGDSWKTQKLPEKEELGEVLIGTRAGLLIQLSSLPCISDGWEVVSVLFSDKWEVWLDFSILIKPSKKGQMDRQNKRKKENRLTYAVQM